ncbi:nuclear transport factor 2 family protein [Novosphingobium mangrovi (ex Huang et al. 2023)]|uniref:Nuclear transport factor 2 family protein n=1 Tax=Novosphingobium mangrovi (ex Huang et al. 2023) TaxID=2976432 RepID=A0ABT2IA71_9SPHN|nr:nuclear transport factor 2 family protein [Novosphingobium mangrovi (ex Huang et al. 2023)]MCT2401722.1 nuclear transport factor 2 family protein [Novosphingobium mangrovi (ex Huang et al. 2023)]
MTFTGPFEDRLAIRELLETYADAVTRRDADAWGATWAQEAEWSLPDYPELGTTKGRPAIVAMWVEAMKAYPGIMFEAWPGSIEITGNTATMRSYTSEVYDQDGTTMRDRGVYEDTCVKIDGRWFFQSRSFRNIHRQHAPKGC